MMGELLCWRTSSFPCNVLISALRQHVTLIVDLYPFIVTQKYKIRSLAFVFSQHKRGPYYRILINLGN